MKKAMLNGYALNGYTLNSTAPVGTILPWLKNIPPAGFLPMKGGEYKQSDYAELYNVVKDIPAFQSENEGYFTLPDLSKLVLQGASNEHPAGEKIDAGLPNIKGKTWLREAWDGLKGTAIVNGADGAFFEDTTEGTLGGIGRAETNGSSGKLGFDASRSNPIYSDDCDTVQPPAFTINYIIKATSTDDAIDGIIDDSTTDVGHGWSGAKIAEEIEKVANMNIYSDEEVIVGYWIKNGVKKPIYRRVFIGSWTAVANNWTSTNISVVGFETLVSASCKRDAKEGNLPTAQVEMGDTLLNIALTAGTQTIKQIILEYTKTTD